MVKVLKFNTYWFADKEYDLIFDKVVKQFGEKINSSKHDPEEEVQLSKKYKIKTVPSTIIEVDGIVKFKRIGCISEPDLMNEINRVLYEIPQ